MISQIGPSIAICLAAWALVVASGFWVEAAFRREDCSEIIFALIWQAGLVLLIYIAGGRFA